jgi:hypothetical protein
MVMFLYLVAFVCLVNAVALWLAQGMQEVQAQNIAAIREIRTSRSSTAQTVQMEKLSSMLPCKVSGNKARFKTRAGHWLSAKVVDRVGKVVFLQRRGHRNGQIFARQIA